MGRKASGLPKERRHVHLTEGAWDRLVQMYGPKGVTPSTVIAKLVDHHIRRVDEKANLASKQLDAADDLVIENE